MNWGGLISGALGLLGGMNGGGSGTSSLDGLYGRASQILDKAMSLYDNNDYARTDAQTLDNYKTNRTNMANDMLSNVDTRTRASGVGPGFSDSEINRQKTRIASDASRDVADLSASLDSTRAARQKALLPNVGDIASLGGIAGNIDSTRNAQHAGELDSLMQIARLIGQTVGRKRMAGNGQTESGMLKDFSRDWS